MSLINYTNTIIYRIVCGEKSIYGHTIHLPKFKIKIKNDYKRGKKTKITTFIMENGGYDKTEWHILENYTECQSLMQANMRVEYHKLKDYTEATKMSKMSKMSKKMSKNTDSSNVAAKPEQKFECPTCKKGFARKYNMERHQINSCKQILQQNTSDTIASQSNSVIPSVQNNIQNQTQNTIQTQNNTNTTNNTIHNNIQNNIVFEIGKENLSDILSIKQKKQILSKMHGSLECLVEHIHCNPKYPQFNNIHITSLSKPYCKTYSDKHKKYITTKTKDAIENMVAHRTDDIQTFLVEIAESGENVSEKNECAIKSMVEKLENDTEYKRNKIDKIRYTIYSYNKP